MVAQVLLRLQFQDVRPAKMNIQYWKINLVINMPVGNKKGQKMINIFPVSNFRAPRKRLIRFFNLLLEVLEDSLENLTGN